MVASWKYLLSKTAEMSSLCLRLAIFIFFSAQSIVCDDADCGKCEFPAATSNHEAMNKIKPLEGKRFQVQDGDYTYLIGICTCASKEQGKSFANAGVIQVEHFPKQEKKTPVVRIVGDIKASDIKGGSEWVYLEYRNGQSYSHSCNKENRRAAIMLNCLPGETVGKVMMLEENTNKTGECYYMFEIGHEALCSADKSSTGMSIGTVLCIIFITLVGLYLIGGILYQRFVVGAKGWEQMPNYAFWQDFGNLQADGCDFICRSRSKSASKQYQGLGDDQLRSDDDDEGRDDRILPL